MRRTAVRGVRCVGRLWSPGSRAFPLGASAHDVPAAIETRCSARRGELVVGRAGRRDTGAETPLPAPTFHVKRGFAERGLNSARPGAAKPVVRTCDCGSRTGVGLVVAPWRRLIHPVWPESRPELPGGPLEAVSTRAITTRGAIWGRRLRGWSELAGAAD